MFHCRKRDGASSSPQKERTKLKIFVYLNVKKIIGYFSHVSNTKKKFPIFFKFYGFRRIIKFPMLGQL